MTGDTIRWTIVILGEIAEDPTTSIDDRKALIGGARARETMTEIDILTRARETMIEIVIRTRTTDVTVVLIRVRWTAGTTVVLITVTVGHTRGSTKARVGDFNAVAVARLVTIVRVPQIPAAD